MTPAEHDQYLRTGGGGDWSGVGQDWMCNVVHEIDNIMWPSLAPVSFPSRLQSAFNRGLYRSEQEERDFLEREEALRKSDKWAALAFSMNHPKLAYDPQGKDFVALQQAIVVSAARHQSAHQLAMRPHTQQLTITEAGQPTLHNTLHLLRESLSDKDEQIESMMRRIAELERTRLYY